MKLIIMFLLIFVLAGCAQMPVITEDGLKLDKDTAANIEDLGVGSVTRKF